MALSIDSWSLGLRFLKLLSPNLRKLISLTGLDLSWCRKTLDSADVGLLGQTLVELPALTRLNLSRTRLTNQLQTVLSQMRASLLHLELRYCDLSENDLIFLSQSHHSNTLRTLDVGYNDLGNHFEHFHNLISVLACHLIALQTQCCMFQKDQLTYLFNMIPKKLCHLRFWNIAGNLAAPNLSFIQQITAFAEHSSLECLLVPIPSELGSMSHQQRQEFVETLNKPFPDLAFQCYCGAIGIRVRRVGMGVMVPEQIN